MKMHEPTAPRERLPEIDILRGIALLGIIGVNMYMYAAPASYWALAGVEPFTGTFDRIVTFLIDTVAQGKFLPIFAFLFGFGAALQWKRLMRRGLDDPAAAAVLRRRFMILLLLGIVHASLIWAGDILAVYAVFGLIVLAWRRWPTRRLLAISGALWAALLAASAWVLIAEVISGGSGATGMSEMQAFFADQAAIALETYAKGSFAAITAQRLFDYVMSLALGWLALLIPFGLLLVGFVAGRDGWWDKDGRLRAAGRLGAWVRWAMLIGLISEAVGSALRLDWLGGGAGWTNHLAELLYVVGTPLLAIGYIGAILRLAEKAAWQKRLEPFAMVGRMSLTNYLMQSVIATTLVYSYGFGLYGRIGPALSFIIAVGIYVLQVVVSGAWLRRYRFGPVEWLWRSFTYGELQPMRPAAHRGG